MNQCWSNVSTPTMTCCKQLQPLPNVCPTIVCYLGRVFGQWVLFINYYKTKSESKLYNFCIIKINLMLRKITLLLSARMFLDQHSRSSNVGPTTVLQLLNQCWVNVSTPTMTCCQQLQPLPNVGLTIASYLGSDCLNPPIPYMGL